MTKNKPTPAIPIDTDAHRSGAADARTIAEYTTAEMKELYEVARDWAAEGIDLRIVSRLLVFQLLERVHKMHGAIEVAFAGLPFIPNLAPTAPENQARFSAYLENHKAVTGFLFELINLVMINPWPKTSSDPPSKKGG